MVAMVPLLTPVSGYYTTFYNHIAMVLTPLGELGKTMAEPHSILQGRSLKADCTDFTPTPSDTLQNTVIVFLRRFHHICLKLTSSFPPSYSVFLGHTHALTSTPRPWKLSLYSSNTLIHFDTFPHMPLVLSLYSLAVETLIVFLQHVIYRISSIYHPPPPKKKMGKIQ